MAEGLRVSFAKLSSGNYVSWRFRMKSLLEREDLWDVVEGEQPEEEEEEEYAQWKKKDVKARATISLFIDDSQLRFVKKAETASEMWGNLKNYHEKATISTQAMLLQQLCSINLGEGADVEKHLEEIENLYDRLDNTGVELSEQLRVIMMLRSLPPSFASFVTSLENRPQEDLTMDLVVARLRDECNKRVGLKAGSSGIGVKEEIAQKVNADDNSDRGKCFYCKQPGHFKRNCRKLAALKSGNSSGEPSGKSGSAQQVKRAQAEKAQQSKPVVADDTICGAVCFAAGGAIPRAWTIDSGCSCHMTNDREFFIEYKSGVVVDVLLADGTRAKSCGIGSGNVVGVNAKGQRVVITLKQVLHVPALEGGLVSVRKLAEKGFTVAFAVDGCEILDSGDKVVAVGEPVCDRYKLKTVELSVAMQGCHTDLCQHTWHRRFGHRGADVVNAVTLASGIEVEDCGERIVCKCCIKGKLTQIASTRSEGRSARPLDLVHVALCGPMQNATPDGNTWFVSLVDDYSYFCKVYLLKSSCEAEGKVQEFMQWAEGVFGRRPKVTMSDGGGEDVRCLIAEQKNRELQEMANCMLMDAGLPKCHWGEALLAANFVQNRLPLAMAEKTPYELWHGEVPDLAELKIFGCEAYVREKLNQKAKKLVFVGYSCHHDGYRFLGLATNRISVSRDAHFLELTDNSGQLEEKRDTSGNPVQQNSVISSEKVIVLENHESGEHSEVLDEQSEFDKTSELNEGDSLELEMKIQKELPVLNGADWRARGVLPGHFETGVVGQVIVHEEPKSRKETILVLSWRTVTDAEVAAHAVNRTWELVSLPPGKDVMWLRRLLAELEESENYRNC